MAYRAIPVIPWVQLSSGQQTVICKDSVLAFALLLVTIHFQSLVKYRAGLKISGFSCDTRWYSSNGLSRQNCPCSCQNHKVTLHIAWQSVLPHGETTRAFCNSFILQKKKCQLAIQSQCTESGCCSQMSLSFFNVFPLRMPKQHVNQSLIKSNFNKYGHTEAQVPNVLRHIT